MGERVLHRDRQHFSGLEQTRCQIRGVARNKSELGCDVTQFRRSHAWRFGLDVSPFGEHAQDILEEATSPTIDARYRGVAILPILLFCAERSFSRRSPPLMFQKPRPSDVDEKSYLGLKWLARVTRAKATRLVSQDGQQYAERQIGLMPRDCSPSQSFYEGYREIKITCQCGLLTKHPPERKITRRAQGR